MIYFNWCVRCVCVWTVNEWNKTQNKNCETWVVCQSNMYMRLCIQSHNYTMDTEIRNRKLSLFAWVVGRSYWHIYDLSSSSSMPICAVTNWIQFQMTQPTTRTSTRSKTGINMYAYCIYIVCIYAYNGSSWLLYALYKFSLIHSVCSRFDHLINVLMIVKCVHSYTSMVMRISM